jgi:serine protease AprX
VLAAPCSTEAEAPEAFAGIATGLPTSFALAAAYPYPLHSSATWSFDVAEAAAVRVAVYDVQGLQVEVLAEGRFEAASHAVFFDGSALPNGLYLVRMSTAGGFSQTQRVTVLR